MLRPSNLEIPSPPLRILAITNMYPSAGSPGRGVFIQEQLKGLEGIGLGVRVLFIDRWREGPLAYYRLAPKVRQEVDNFAPDLLHIMYGGVMAHQVITRCRLRPSMITFHGSDLLGENLSGYLRKLISRYGVWCSRQAARKADGIIVVARHLLKALPPALDPAKIRVLPCGIDVDVFRPMAQPACRQKLGWSNGPFHVLFASSNADPVKRPWLAKAAVDELRKRGTAVELHVMSNVPYSAVPVWLNASDALLLTSLHEGSPTIVKEALACDLPVVSLDVGDVAERIAHIQGCHLAKPDAADLANKLYLVCKQRARLNCHTQIDELSTVNAARHLQEFYEFVIARGNTSTPSHLLRKAHFPQNCPS